jgi:large subunit ribosomal protein L22
MWPAKQGMDLDVDNLYVKQAIANDGPRMKRIRPAPMGRAYRYQRRLTHIVLSVAERHRIGSLVTRVEEPATSAAAKAAKAKKGCDRRQEEAGEARPQRSKTAPRSRRSPKKARQEGLEGI